MLTSLQWIAEELTAFYQANHTLAAKILTTFNKCQSCCFHNHHHHYRNSTVAAAQGHHSWRSLLAPVQHRKTYCKSKPKFNVNGDVHTPEHATCPMSRVHSMYPLAWEALASANNVMYNLWVREGLFHTEGGDSLALLSLKPGWYLVPKCFFFIQRCTGGHLRQERTDCYTASWAQAKVAKHCLEGMTTKTAVERLFLSLNAKKSTYSFYYRTGRVLAMGFHLIRIRLEKWIDSRLASPREARRIKKNKPHKSNTEKSTRIAVAGAQLLTSARFFWWQIRATSAWSLGTSATRTPGCFQSMTSHVVHFPWSPMTWKHEIMGKCGTTLV